jgi:outer membrane protein assembly factor BamB
VLSQGQAAVSRCSPETLPTLAGQLPLKNLRIYSGSPTGNLYAFDAVQGTMRWCHHIDMLPQQMFIYPIYVPAPPPPKAIGTPAVANGLVYVCADNGYVYAFNTSDGSYRWSTAIGTFAGFQPVYDDGTLYTEGSTENQENFYALNASDGSVRWKASIELYSTFLAAGTLYGSDGNALYALNTSNGSVRWQFQNDSSLDGTPTGANGLVYTSSSDGYRVYALDANTGALRWSYWVGPAPSSPMVANGVVYVTAGTAGTGDTLLYALSASDGTLLWSLKVGAINPDTPVLANGVIYLAGDGLYALDARQGTLLWHNALGFTPMPPAVTNTGIFVQSEDGNSIFDLLHPQDGAVLAQMSITDAHYSPPITSVVLAP